MPLLDLNVNEKLRRVLPYLVSKPDVERALAGTVLEEECVETHSDLILNRLLELREVENKLFSFYSTILIKGWLLS